MYNKITLIGHAGKDAEVKHLDGGQIVATVSLATTEKWQDKQGVWQEKTQWHLVVMWGKLAERAEQFKKGMQLLVEGKIEYREYTTTSGEKKQRTEVNAGLVNMLSKKEQADNQSVNSTAPEPVVRPQEPTPPPPPAQIDDLPF